MVGSLDGRHCPDPGFDHDGAGELHRRFSGALPTPPYLPRMESGDVTLPAPVHAVWGADARAAERWADGLRADLARLEAQLRRLEAEADAAERGRAGAGGEGGPEGGEDDLLRLVDGMLSAARARVESVLRLAREESSEVVARALDQASALVRPAGGDPVRDSDDEVIVLDALHEEGDSASDRNPRSRHQHDSVPHFAHRERQ